MSHDKMTFYFCLAILFMPLFLGALAENTDKPVPKVRAIEADDLDYGLYMRYFEEALAESKGKSVLEDPTPLTIGDSNLNTNADQDFKDKDHLFHESYILYRQYSDHRDRKTPLAVLHSSHIGDNNANNIHRRNVLDTGCMIPLELKDSNVKCSSHDNKLVCTHFCQFGHAFSEGMIEREMECIYGEGRWTPVPDFEGCKQNMGKSVPKVRAIEADDLDYGLYMRYFEKALAESKGKSVLEDPTSLTIGDSNLNTNSDQDFKDKDHLFHENYILYSQYSDHRDRKTPLAVLHSNHIGDNNANNIHRRNVLDTGCMIPLELKDSNVKCSSHDNKLVCTHFCQFGHAFSEGIIEREMECIYGEGRWTPVPDFEGCKRLDLIPPSLDRKKNFGV